MFGLIFFIFLLGLSSVTSSWINACTWIHLRKSTKKLPIQDIFQVTICMSNFYIVIGLYRIIVWQNLWKYCIHVLLWEKAMCWGLWGQNLLLQCSMKELWSSVPLPVRLVGCSQRNHQPILHHFQIRSHTKPPTWWSHKSGGRGSVGSSTLDINLAASLLSTVYSALLRAPQTKVSQSIYNNFTITSFFWSWNTVTSVELIHLPWIPLCSSNLHIKITL